MKITSVNVRISDTKDSKMKGIASVIVDDCFAIHDIRIIEGENGLFTAMPSRKTSTGNYRDVAHPITTECRKMFDDAILTIWTQKIHGLSNPSAWIIEHFVYGTCIFSSYRRHFAWIFLFCTWKKSLPVVIFYHKHGRL